MCYMCIQWSRVLYSVVITRQSNPPISQFNSPCNDFTSVWSMFQCNNYNLSTETVTLTSCLLIEERSKSPVKIATMVDRMCGWRSATWNKNHKGCCCNNRSLNKYQRTQIHAATYETWYNMKTDTETRSRMYRLHSTVTGVLSKVLVFILDNYLLDRQFSYKMFSHNYSLDIQDDFSIVPVKLYLVLITSNRYICERWLRQFYTKWEQHDIVRWGTIFCKELFPQFTTILRRIEC